tara:strand:- start:161 stop:655 length:495 start_codon:yes stop_codon:yes gene_type:complete
MTNLLILKKSSIFNFCCKKNLKWMNDIEVTKYLSVRSKTTILSSSLYFFKETFKKSILLSLYFNKSHIGNCGFFNLNNDESSYELRILIGEKKFWGMGLGKKAVILMLDYLKNNSNYIHFVWLNVSVNNLAANKLYSSVGFQLSDEKYKTIDGQIQNKMKYYFK